MRGDPDSGRFALYYLAQGELLAVDAINSPKDFMAGQEVDRGAQAPGPRAARGPVRRSQAHRVLSRRTARTCVQREIRRTIRHSAFCSAVEPPRGETIMSADEAAGNR